MKELARCEKCGKKCQENDLECDEDSHDLLCPECYHQGLSEN
jgi:hypothetical protein